MTDAGVPIRIWQQSFTVLEDLPDYAELLRKHAQKVTRPSTSVELHGMRPGTYPSGYPGDHIRFSYLQRRHAQQFVDAALKAQAEGFDAYFISTLPDIALEDIRTLVDVPVIGLGQASMLVAATLASPVGLISFIDALRPQVQRNAVSYGFSGLLGPLIAIEAGFRDVVAGYATPGPLIDTFRSAARNAIAQGARVIIPGEGPLNVLLAEHGVREVDGVSVIDSIAAGLKLCELRVDLSRDTGLAPTRAGGLYYDHPPARLVAAVDDFYKQ
jgi:allantoin racemase